MLGLYHDWSAGDVRFSEIFAPDDEVLAIGSDAEEWWDGGRNAAAIFDRQTTQFGRFAIESGSLRAYAHGDVGWAGDKITIRFFDNDVVVQMRLTAVFERRDREWLVVQWHASMAQANEETLGFDLDTSIDAVAEWAEQERPDLTSASTIDGTVTILFTDIEGSTALNESLGDQRWSELVKEHDRYMRELVAAHDGTTVQRMGDGFMLAFPSARKGLGCAIAVQQGLADDERIRVRIGAHTGEPIREAGEFYGRDVAYAARVGAAANGGEILVSDLVARLCAGGSYVFDGPRALEFKGFEGEQSVFAVDWARI
jgi:class 3 adenylate cyclase